MSYHKPLNKCITRFCRTFRGEKSPLCNKCSLRRWRAANPIKARLAVLRDRAQRKKVPFDLTVPWLTEFLSVNTYDPKTQHIDREKPWLGYVMGNLQILAAGEN